MDLVKAILIVISFAWLLVGATVLVVGLASKSAARRKLGLQALGAWLVYDLICVILAFCLGWFK